jgi:quercetin dioxygenase-like cupin family protein
MNTNIESYISKSGTMEWKPLVEQGVDTKGLYVKSLRFDEKQKRSPSILLKFEPGAKYPYHNHPAGEEIFVLKGTCFVNDAILNSGDYLYTPPGYKHAVRSVDGCEMLLIIPSEVEVLDKKQEYY